MGHQPPALEKLFDEWAKKHEENLSQEAPYFMDHEAPYGKFVRDGIVNFDNWKKQKVRICFVLHEASGYSDIAKYPNGHDVAAEWNEKGSFSKFMFKLAVWTKAVNDAFAAAPVTYVKKELLPISHDLIRSIAVVNIKKSDGQKRPNYSTVKNFAHVDYAELRRELEIINANIILFCDNYYFLVGKRPKPEAQGAEEAPAPEIVVPPAPEIVTPETLATEGIAAAEEAAAAEAQEKKSEIMLPRAFYFDELKPVAKFAFAWNNKLCFQLWSPANFVGTLSSNTINYYAVREIVRAALKVFGQKTAAAKAKAAAPAKPAAPAPAK